MPMLETKTQGFAFACLASGADAALVVKGLEGHRLDKSHVLAVNFFDDVETYGAMEDEYVEPEIAEYEEKEHLKSWLYVTEL
jgi:translation initiation factor 3 subunit B